jgi:hypothetical protein
VALKQPRVRDVPPEQEPFESKILRKYQRRSDTIDETFMKLFIEGLATREIERVDQRNTTPAWQAFAKTLRRLLHDALRLRARPDFSPQRYARRITRLEQRLAALADRRYADADATRLARRLDRHRDHLFTFLHKPDMPPDNNHAER